MNMSPVNSSSAFHRPPSPLANKRARLDRMFIEFQPPSLTFTEAPPASGLLVSPSMVTDAPSTVVDANYTEEPSLQHGEIMDEAVRSSIGSPVSGCSGEGYKGSLQASLDELDVAAHAVRTDIAGRDKSDKQTGAAYARHVSNYLRWWGDYQARLSLANPHRHPVPPEPITAAKAVMFLQYETTRPKRKRGTSQDQEGTSVGQSSISQTISALEDRRSEHQHLYKTDRDAQIGLRTDRRIRTIEASSKHNEPNRVAKAQALKAAGTSADTYGDGQLSNMAASFLRVQSGPRKLFTAIRDRAMILTSTSTAFRGDSSRGLLWSDLFTRSVPMHSIGRDRKVPALVLYADNAKTNQQGRVDEFGAFRHLHVELCPIGSLALLFFAHFHILRQPVPDFTPDVSDSQFGEYGRRDWYSYYVFYASHLDTEMSYDNHRHRVNLLHLQNNISITKVTHAGRSFAAQTSRGHGASSSDTKALGGWSESGSFRSCYDRQLPIEALISAAMFDGRNPGTYFIARDKLDPPLHLEKMLFPWIEQQLEDLSNRERQSPLAKDICLFHFLNVLRWFRRVLLQDMAVLFSRQPDAYAFEFAPFNSAMFRSFAAGAEEQIRVSEEKARLALKNLPEHVIGSVKGMLTGFDLTLQEDRNLNDTRWQSLSQDLHGVRSLLEDLSAAGMGRHHKRTLDSSSLSTPMSRSLTSSPLPPPPLQTAAQKMRPSAPPPLALSSSEPLPARPTTLAPLASVPIKSFVHSSGTPFTASPSTVISPIQSNVTINLVPSLPAAVDAASSSGDIHLASPHENASNGTESSSTPPHLRRPTCSERSDSLSHPRTPSTPLVMSGSSLSMEVMKWAALVERYGDAKLRKHPDWLFNGDWLPVYEFQPAQKITEVWTEWADGITPYLSVRFLCEVWGAKWKRNIPSIKQNATRRMKIVRLIQALEEKRRWDVPLALRFLREKYEPLYTARQFPDFLGMVGTGSGWQAVLGAAAVYP